MIRLIIDGKHEGTMNMALDLALAYRSSLEKVSTIRIYEWTNPTISLGKHQKNCEFGFKLYN